MSNLKNVIIYLLSVLIAFESGVLLFIIGMFTVTNDLKNEQRNRIEELVTHLIVTKIEPAMALSFYPRLDTVRRLP